MFCPSASDRQFIPLLMNQNGEQAWTYSPTTGCLTLGLHKVTRAGRPERSSWLLRCNWRQGGAVPLAAWNANISALKRSREVMGSRWRAMKRRVMWADLGWLAVRCILGQLEGLDGTLSSSDKDHSGHIITEKTSGHENWRVKSNLPTSRPAVLAKFWASNNSISTRGEQGWPMPTLPLSCPANQRMNTVSCGH